MQRYRLRLGDGTILHVDRAALGTWSIDERAMVQTVGSQRWQPLQQFLAHERALSRQMSADEPAPTRSADSSAGPPPPSVVAEPARIGEPGGIQALADEPGEYGSTAGRDLAGIPLKASEDDAAGHGRSPTRGDVGSRTARALLGSASRFGGFLGRLVDRVERLEERLSRAEREGGGEAPPTFQRASTVEGGWQRVAARLRLLAVRARGRSAEVLGSLGLINRPSPPAVPGRPAAPDRFHDPDAPAVPGPPVVTPPGLEPAATREPPPAIASLPALRLAPLSEPVEEIEGDARVGRAAAGSLVGVIGVVRGAWPHARRYLAVAAVIALGAWAVVARDVWIPAVTGIGRTAFTEIDERVRARHQAQGHEQALREAAQQIPQLAPATLELVLTRSPTGILGPAEVFRLAREATDRGSSSLTADERRELARLRRDLLRSLSQVERDELRDYDRARAQRASFAFEDEEALRLSARGARSLPPPSLERLRELYGKAIAAALATKDVSSDGTETAKPGPEGP